MGIIWQTSPCNFGDRIFLLRGLIMEDPHNCLSQLRRLETAFPEKRREITGVPPEVKVINASLIDRTDVNTNEEVLDLFTSTWFIWLNIFYTLFESPTVSLIQHLLPCCFLLFSNFNLLNPASSWSRSGSRWQLFCHLIHRASNSADVPLRVVFCSDTSVAGSCWQRSGHWAPASRALSQAWLWDEAPGFSFLR